MGNKKKSEPKQEQTAPSLSLSQLRGSSKKIAKKAISSVKGGKNG